MRKTKETFEMDTLVVNTLRKHIGKDNAIGGEELYIILRNNGYVVNRRSIVSIIKRIIEQRYIPVCSLNGNGYYLPNCKEDIVQAIAHLQARVDGLNNRINFLKQFIY